MNAIEAKFEAQKISFAPLVFQAVRALIETGALSAVAAAKEDGLTLAQIAQHCNITPYAARLLADIALEAHIFDVIAAAENDQTRFTLGKVGYFLLEDEMTRANFNFVHDVCYQGAFHLPDALRTGKPAGLPVFGGNFATIYEALSSLPDHVKKSWFEFDHYYSDCAFPAALPYVFETPRRLILDIGGNTAKWAIACCAYNNDVEVIIADLPGQAALAEKNAAAAGFSRRIHTHCCNVLDENARLPSGASAVWMSQFLDCFSLDEVTAILKKVASCIDAHTDVYVLEPLIDRQRFEAAAFSLRAASLYFTCMANGNSRFFYYDELQHAVECAGFALADAHHDIGHHSYSLLRFRKASA